MDPSGTLGFYCKSQADFDRLIDQTEQVSYCRANQKWQWRTILFTTV